MSDGAMFEGFPTGESGGAPATLEGPPLGRPPGVAQVNILIVDDHPESLLAMQGVLADLGENLVTARSGREALRHLLDHDFALVLMDVRMSDMDGFETAAMILSRERSRQTPIIFLTAGHRSEMQVFRGYALGAVDYILKPVVPEILRSKVRVFVELARARRSLEQAARVEHARAALSEEKYRSLMEHANDAVMILDGQGALLEVNPCAERLFGRARSHLLGASFDTLVAPTPGPARSAARRLIEGGGAHADAFEILHADGQPRWVEVSASTVHTDDAPITVAIARDVTERRRAKESLERSVKERTAELETSNKELEAFSYSVAHDLRAPLRSIIGYSQILSQEWASRLDPEALSHLEQIGHSTRRMSQLISDLLDLSRVTREEMRRSEVDLTTLAYALVAELSAGEPSRAIEFRVSADLTAHGDERLLRMALGNLLSNAWKFTRDAAQPRIEFGVDAVDGEAVFRVRDNGIGFDMRHKDKLFGAFQRLHVNEFDGTGIGLAIVQRIVLRHGGRIWADGVEGEGATFSFTLKEAPQHRPGEAVRTA